MKMEESDFPALYNAADSASSEAQSNYFNALRLYLILLVAAAFTSFSWPQEVYGAIVSVALFLVPCNVYKFG